MNRKAWSQFSIKSIDEDARIIQGIASTPTPDRASDVVSPMGAKFSIPMPFLWQHNSEQPIGHVTAATPTAKGIPVTVKIAKVNEPGSLQELLNHAWGSIKAGLVRGLSIGFMPIPGETERLANGGLFYKSWIWLELSAVTIPCNQEASILAIKRYGRKTLPVVKFAEPVRDSVTLAEIERALESGENPHEIIARHTIRRVGELILPMADEITALKQRIKALEGK